MIALIDAIPPMVAYVRQLDDDLYRCVEVADALDTSPANLRRLARTHPELGPSRLEAFRGVPVWLYGMDRVTEISRFLDGHVVNAASRAGARRLWAPAERRRRRARHSAASYQRRRAAWLEAAGDHPRAGVARRRADEIAEELRSERAVRRREREYWASALGES